MQKTILATGMLLISSSAIAEPYWQVSFSGGTAALDADDTVMHLSSTQDNKIIQTNDKQWKTGAGQAGIGYVFPLWEHSHWFTAIEPQLNYYYLNGNIDGRVDRYYQHNVNCNDVNFLTDFTSNRVMLDVSLTIATYEVLSLYGIAGVGPSWNQLEFKQAEDQYYPAIEGSHTDTNFAYDVGAGLSLDIIENVALTAEYLFAGFVNLTLDGPDGVSSDDINVNAQTILFGFSVAF